MLKLAYFHAYWALFCIKVALVTDRLLSNNQVENAIRPIVVGRKNWLFCDTQAGANASVVVFTLLETAKANGLNPETWLNHILSVLPDRFARNPDASIDELMPWTDVMHRQFAL